MYSNFSFKKNYWSYIHDNFIYVYARTTIQEDWFMQVEKLIDMFKGIENTRLKSIKIQKLNLDNIHLLYITGLC